MSEGASCLTEEELDAMMEIADCVHCLRELAKSEGVSVAAIERQEALAFEASLRRFLRLSSAEMSLAYPDSQGSSYIDASLATSPHSLMESHPGGNNSSSLFL